MGCYLHLLFGNIAGNIVVGVSDETGLDLGNGGLLAG